MDRPKLCLGRGSEGIARRENFTIFVEGAQKGQVAVDEVGRERPKLRLGRMVKIKINKVSGTLAFAQLVHE